MTETVIVALIGVVGSFFGTLTGIMINTKLTNYRIEQLEKKVDKHNHVVERVFILERDKAVFEEEMKVANHRIEDLESYHK